MAPPRPQGRLLHRQRSAQPDPGAAGAGSRTKEPPAQRGTRGQQLPRAPWLLGVGGKGGIFWVGRGSPWELAKNPASSCQQGAAGGKTALSSVPQHCEGSAAAAAPQDLSSDFSVSLLLLLLPTNTGSGSPWCSGSPWSWSFLASTSFRVSCATGAPSAMSTLHASTPSHIAGARGIRLPVFIWLQQPPLSLWGSPF